MCSALDYSQGEARMSMFLRALRPAVCLIPIASASDIGRRFRLRSTARLERGVRFRYFLVCTLAVRESTSAAGRMCLSTTSTRSHRCSIPSWAYHTSFTPLYRPMHYTGRLTRSLAFLPRNYQQTMMFSMTRAFVSNNIGLMWVSVWKSLDP